MITYIEDAFAQYDFQANKNFKEKLQNELPEVNMGLKQLFMSGGLERMRNVTDFQYIEPQVPMESSVEELKEEEVKDDKKKPVTPVKGGKKAPEAPTPNNTNKMDFPEFDPKEPNKNKITPDCVNLNMPRITTMSEMLKFFVHAHSLEDEQQFSLIISDSQIDSPLATEIVDLAIGIGA